MSSSEQQFLVALRNKFESKKTWNIYAREQYNELWLRSNYWSHQKRNKLQIITI